MRSYSDGDDVMKRQRNRRRVKAVGRIKQQLYDVDIWRSAAAEFLATFIFLFIVCFTLMVPSNSAGNTMSNKSNQEDRASIPLQASIGIALTYGTLIQCFESISGAYMNPAVSMAMVVAGHISVVKAFLYSIAQMTGAFSAVALCFGIIPDQMNQKLAVSRLSGNLTSLQGFGIELLQSLLLTVTWLATYVTSRHQLGSSALPVSIVVLANSLWAGQLTGSSTNPARSIPPAVLTGSWENVWIYVVGPLAGCVIGAVLYSQIFVTAPKKQSGSLNGATRNIEGESVKSDEAADPLPRFNQDPEIQTTNFTSPRNDMSVKSTSTRDLPNVCFPQKTFSRSATPSVRHQMQNTTVPMVTRMNHYVTPHSQKLYRQSSVPAQRSAAMLQPLPYAPSNGSNSNNVTLTREGSRVPSRCSTACGSLTTKPVKTNGFDNTLQSQTTCSSFQHSNAMDPLLKEGVL